MNIMDFDSFKIKNNFLENSYISSLMLRRNKQFNNNFKKKINQEIFHSPFRQNILPMINKYSNLIILRTLSSPKVSRIISIMSSRFIDSESKSISIYTVAFAIL